MTTWQAPLAKDRLMAARRLSGLQLTIPIVLLGGCALVPADGQTGRTYAGVEPARLYDQTLMALRETDLEVVESDAAHGMIVAAARFDQRGWADCPSSLRLAQDRDERQYMVEAAESHREVELAASVTDAPEGATLTLEPAFSTQPVSPMASTEACVTTGVLERQILDAVSEPT